MTEQTRVDIGAVLEQILTAIDQDDDPDLEAEEQITVLGTRQVMSTIRASGRTYRLTLTEED